MLNTENLSYHLNGSKLLKEISLQFKPGHLYGILGPNGSGKSTLLKTLSGIWTPTAGRVLWNGEDLFKYDRKSISRTITLVPQNVQHYFDFTVSEVVKMGRYPHSFKNKELDNQLLDEALKSVDISHLKERFVSQLSSGERQRVYIARALMTESPILLLDEPTASLDIRHQLDIWQLLKTLLPRDKIIIIACHDLISAKKHCDEIAVMHQGQCVAVGKYAEVMNATLLKSVFNIEEHQL